MSTLLQEFEQEQVQELMVNREIPEFSPGDTVRIVVTIVDGTSKRGQAFEGVCIARRNAGMHSSFTIRKISHGEGVERTFPLFSPRIESIEVKRHGKVRRAKLYYMRDLRGKAARIQEKRYLGAEAASEEAEAVAPKETAKETPKETKAKKSAAKNEAAPKKSEEDKKTDE